MNRNETLNAKSSGLKVYQFPLSLHSKCKFCFIAIIVPCQAVPGAGKQNLLSPLWCIVKARVTPEGLITQISRSRFKQSKISAHTTYRYIYDSGFCVNSLMIYLGINSFSQGISEIYGNKKF